MYWVYIMASRSGVIYTGVTSDLEGRVWQHQEGSTRGFASRYRCNRLVFADSFASVRDAIAAEKKLKGWRRSKKVALINKDNPAWEDISGMYRSSSHHPERDRPLAPNDEPGAALPDSHTSEEVPRLRAGGAGATLGMTPRKRSLVCAPAAPALRSG